MKAAAVQMTSGRNQTENLAAAGALIASAAEQGARLVVLPENFALFGVDDSERIAAAAPAGRGEAERFLARQARAHRIWLVGGTVALLAPDGRAHAASLLYDPAGRLAARYDKIHLFDVDVPGNGEERYRESRATAPGSEPICVETELGRIGMVVCYDIRFPALAARLAALGVEILAVPAAFTVATGEAHWEVLLRARAIESLAYVIAAAQSGRHDGGRRTYGHSMIVGPWGKVLGVREREPGVVCSEIDMMRLRSLRASFPVLQHRQEL